MKTQIQEFVLFVREQGVVGMAIGLVLGAEVKELVAQLVASFVDPAIGMLLGDRKSLEDARYTLVVGERSGEFLWGKFMSVSIQFVAVAAVVFWAVRLLKVDRDAVREMSKEAAKG